MFAGLWLAGYGPYRLSRTFQVAPIASLLAGLVAQTSPVVLRAVPNADLAALAIGALALGVAVPRLAWLGGLWSWPGAVGFLLIGGVRRNPWWILAGLPALAAGVLGYVVKCRLASDLLPALRDALARRSFLSPPLRPERTGPQDT